MMKNVAPIMLASLGTALLVFGWLNRQERLYRASDFFDRPGTIVAAVGAAAIVAGLLLRRRDGSLRLDWRGSYGEGDRHDDPQPAEQGL